MGRRGGLTSGFGVKAGIGDDNPRSSVCAVGGFILGKWGGLTSGRGVKAGIGDDDFVLEAVREIFTDGCTRSAAVDIDPLTGVAVGGFNNGSFNIALACWANDESAVITLFAAFNAVGLLETLLGPFLVKFFKKLPTSVFSTSAILLKAFSDWDLTSRGKWPPPKRLAKNLGSFFALANAAPLHLMSRLLAIRVMSWFHLTIPASQQKNLVHQVVPQ